MKFKKWFVGAAVLTFGLLTSCKEKDNEPKQSGESTTYMSVAISMGQSLRAGGNEGADFNHKGTWAGQDDIKSVDIYMVSAAKEVEHLTATFVPGSNNGNHGVLTVEAFKTTPGSKKIYAVVNNSGAVQTVLNTATAANFDTEYKKAVDLYNTASVSAGKDIILMTGEPIEATIRDNIKKEEANLATNGVDKNRFKIAVRRSVARVSATLSNSIEKSGDSYIIKGDIKKADGSILTGQTLGTLSGLKWVARQFEKESYILYKDTDGHHTYDVAAKVASPNFEYGKTTMVTDEESKKRYVYPTIEKTFGTAGEASSFDDAVAAQKEATSMFVTETTHPYTIGTTDYYYKKGNTTYVIVQGTFKPDQALLAQGEVAPTGETNPSIYWGTSTGLFYYNLEKAKAANTPSDTSKGQDGVVEYKAGTMYYIAYVNPNKFTPTEWEFSPVVCNNVYNINVKAFKKLGLYHDPNDPNSPEDPDKPDDDPDKPIKDQETHMAYEITVINWGVHTYDIDF